MAYYHTLYDKVSWTEWFSVMWHGLPLDFSMAGYLTIIPGLLLIASAWTDSKKTTTDTPHLYHNSIHITLLHIYKRSWIIWLLGIPA